MNKVKIKNMLLNDIKESLKIAPNNYNVEIKIKNLLEAVNIASAILEDLRNNEQIDDILHYVEVSFNILISPQKLYVMSYFYEIYDDMFFTGIENNKENISESHMRIFVSIFDLKYFKKHREMSEKEFEERFKMLEEIFVRNNASVEKDYFEGVVDRFKFIYPLETEVFWFLV